jgi:hypothetical protein
MARDERIVAFIKHLLRTGTPVRLTALSLDTVRAGNIIHTEAKLSGRRAIPKIGLPHWDHAAAHLKMIAWGIASWELDATPFTLKLSVSVIAAADADRRGHGRYLQDRISRHLRHGLEFTPAYWFSIEMGVGDDPHLHGAIVRPRGKEDAIRRALLGAGGSTVSPARQLKFSKKLGAVGWMSYATKWLYRTRAHMKDDNTCGATHSLRVAANEWYRAAREREQVIYPV